MIKWDKIKCNYCLWQRNE